MAISIEEMELFLGLCRRLAKNGVPVCGINIGHLGFLADIEPSEIEAKLTKIVKKEYKIEQRLMLSAFIKRENEIKYVGSAVNDIVVSKCGVSRMLHFNLSINDYTVTSYKADGLIIFYTNRFNGLFSISCGSYCQSKSKRYNRYTYLSTCLFYSSMVIDESEQVKLDIINIISMSKRSVNLTLDGQESIDIEPNDEISFKRLISLRKSFVLKIRIFTRLL